MDDEIATGNLARLFGVTAKTVADLGKRGIIVSAGKRGRWQLQASVTDYVRRLREEAAARDGEAGQSARERLGAAQADLAEAKAAQIRGETVPVAEVETFWRSKLKAFRNRVLAVPGRVRDLTARQNVLLNQELRACLEELAEHKG